MEALAVVVVMLILRLVQELLDKDLLVELDMRLLLMLVVAVVALVLLGLIKHLQQLTLTMVGAGLSQL
jgi:hypothetical protein